MRRLAWGIAGATAALAAASVVFGFSDDGTRLPAGEGATVSGPAQLTFGVMVIAFAALGALLASRRPRNPIGWLLCAAPLALALSGFADGWYVHAFYAHPGSPKPPVALLWVANWIWVFGFIPLITALLLLFPDGRLPSRRWWPAGALVLAAILCLFAGYAFAPGALDDYRRVENPLGLGPVFLTLQDAGFPLMALSAITSAAALIWRFRRSHGVERQQLKWMAAAAALVVAAWLANAALDQFLGVQSSYFLPDRAARAARRRDRGDPPLPPVRPRADRQPHARLPRAHRHARRRLSRARAADRAHARHVQRRDRGLHAGRRGALPAPAIAHPGRGRPAASTAAATTRSARSTRSARGCATRSTSTASARTSTPRCSRRCSRRTCRCG